MDKRRIGVFDSGIGGLTILEKLKIELPNEDYIYYADSKNNPYGEKDIKELFKITEDIVDYLLANDCKIIVIACNTATTQCIEHLRKEYPNIKFIGTEPAVKVACDKNYKEIVVMATPQTIVSERLELLIADNLKDNQNIYLAPCEGLAHAIEVGDQETIKNVLERLKKEYESKNIDAIVLGCTHYPIIKDLIATYFPQAELIDGGFGVAKETKRQLLQNNLINDSGTRDVIFINSLKKDTNI